MAVIIGLFFSYELDELPAIASLSQEYHVLLLVKHEREPVQENLMIVCYYQTDILLHIGKEDAGKIKQCRSVNGNLDKIICAYAGFGLQRQHSVEYFTPAFQATESKSVRSGKGLFLVKAPPVVLGQE